MWVSFWFYREENDDRCGGSPLILNLMFCLGYVFFDFRVGEITQGRCMFYTLVLPSVIFSFGYYYF